jgi:hypothetical protein
MSTATVAEVGGSDAKSTGPSTPVVVGEVTMDPIKRAKLNELAEVGIYLGHIVLIGSL